MPGSDLEEDAPFDPETDDFLHLAFLKERQYRHFDNPLSGNEREQGFDLEKHDISHRFHPLLGFTDTKRRVIRDISTGALVTKNKPRLIRYASHADAAYLEVYGAQLSRIYEKSLIETGISDCVLAYRPLGGTNVHHAKRLFDEIRKRENCNVIAIDISGFFDTLDHRHLKSELASVVNRPKLEGHDWNVFKNIAKFSWVETDDLDKVLGKSRPMGGRICSPTDYQRHVRGSTSGLVRVHDLPFGIPQGTPVSGLFANIYMMSFDQDMQRLMQTLGGSYRRYSDDIALVAPSDVEPEELVEIARKILADYELCLSDDKTDISRFYGPVLHCDHAIQYLGFEFNGKETTIRESSLNSYREKMQNGIRAKLLAAKRKNIPASKVFKREVLSRYTHLGRRRNFLKYAFRSAELLGAPEIRQQVKGHMRWFNRAWIRNLNDVYN
jgi:RNA-directed DNA polymerase